MQWHHIVEQNPSNRARFQAEWLHSDLNVVRITSRQHVRINSIYSAIYSPGVSFRQHVSSMPYEEQYRIGREILDKVKDDIR